jgi:solute carrier family 25 carnitine/acylcarnitine transporter 20/29
MISSTSYAFSPLLFSSSSTQHYYLSRVPSCHPPHRHSPSQDESIKVTTSSTSLSVILGTGAASLLAGSLGGAVGVGVAYPFDTLKTKSQVYRRELRQRTKIKRVMIDQNNITTAVAALERRPLVDDSSCDAAEVVGGHLHFMEHHDIIDDINEYYDDGSDNDVLPPEDDDNLFSLIIQIFKNEGISGFFGGVRGMMAGQAIIKSVAFSTNELALSVLLHSSNNNNYNHDASLLLDGVGTSATTTSFGMLILAAGFSGFVTSFLVAPVERVKVMMQAQQQSSVTYTNELECIQAVLKQEGWNGLFLRGLGPTMLREVPSYAIYFVVYRVLMNSFEGNLGSAAPLLCGAISGCACWIPVYPIDVVKTLVQNTEGGKSSESAIDVAIQLYKDEGIQGYFNGLTPKMLRASVNHAVTFWVYDLVIDVLI